MVIYYSFKIRCVATNHFMSGFKVCALTVCVQSGNYTATGFQTQIYAGSY